MRRNLRGCTGFDGSSRKRKSTWRGRAALTTQNKINAKNEKVAKVSAPDFALAA